MRELNIQQEKRAVRYGGHSVSDILAIRRCVRDLIRLTNCRRPGILVLVNDADWELEGEDQYELKRNDNILFVSTLHGG